MTLEQLIAYLKAQVTVYGTQKALARHLGVGEAFLSDVIRGHRQPGEKMLLALGCRKVVTYEWSQRG